MPERDPVVEHCRAMIRDGSKSFFGAARIFGARTRESAFLLYAWCRHCDDQVDGETLGFRLAPGEPYPRRRRLERLFEETRRSLRGDEASALPILREDRRRQAVRDVVCDLDGMCIVTDSHEGHHGTKHLFLLIVASRQKMAELTRPAGFRTADLLRGGYVVVDGRDTAGAPPHLVLIGSGSEVGVSLVAAKHLGEKGVRCRVVSMPCLELFDRQDAAWKDAVLPPGIRRVAIEAGRPDGWWRFVGLDGLVSKKKADFIGKRSLEQSYLKGPNRK